MSVLVFSCICLVAAALSVLSVFDLKIVNNLLVRLATLGVFAMYWTEPLATSSRSLGLPLWVGFAVPAALLIPFLLTTVVVPIRRQMRNREPFPDAVRSDDPFPVYRNRYLHGHYTSRLLWDRLYDIFMTWDDLDRVLVELKSIVKDAPDEKRRIEYALRAADLMADDLGSPPRAVRLLRAAIPLVQDPQRLYKKLTLVCLLPERTGIQTPLPKQRV